MKLDVAKVQARLSEVHAIDEKIADRVPLKVLPRPYGEAPDVPALKARLEDLKQVLRVKRNYTTPKGHDLDGSGLLRAGLDLAAIGIVEEVRAIKKGQDRAIPNATQILRVGFPAGEHLWFDAADLAFVPVPKEKAHAP